MKQTFEDMIEIMIINDCSTDATDATVREIIKKFQQTDRGNRKICYINSETNKGVAESRNCGMRLAEGEYIAFLDAPDWLFA